MVRCELIQNVIGMAIIDESFREVLVADAVTAVQDFGLTEAEINLLACAQAETFEQFSAQLDRLLLDIPQTNSERKVFEFKGVILERGSTSVRWFSDLQGDKESFSIARRNVR